MWPCVHCTLEQTACTVQAFQDQPQQQQDSQQQQQLNEEPVPSSTSFQAPGGPLQADCATASSSHTTGTPRHGPAATETQPRPPYAPPAAHSAAERLTEAVGHMNVTETGAMSVEEVRASHHTRAMAPGIDALRRRRAAALQQQSAAEDGTSLSRQQAQQTSGDAEPQHAAVEEDAVAEATMMHNQLQAATQMTDHTQVDHAGTSQDQELHASSRRLHLPPDTESGDATWTDAAADHHAGDISGVSSPEDEHDGAVTSADQAKYESLLDAIASGSLDWEPAAQQSSSSQASEQEPTEHQHTQTQLQTRLQSHQNVLDPTYLPQQMWPEQAEAMPSTSTERPGPQSAAPPAAPAAAAPSQQPATPGPPTATHVPTQQQTATEASQESEAQSSQEFANSEQSQQRPAEAAQQSWPWDDRRAADAPTLSADVLARSGSRLRLRTASSSSLRPQKQSSRKAARRSQTPSSLLNSRNPGSQGTLQEDKWRVITSEETTAEEFVKPPVDIDNGRPVWAASAVAPAARAGAGEGAAQDEAATNQSAPPSESRPLTKQELRALAARQGLDFERLLADALSRGIPVSD